jgi:hypothetical protein
MRYLSDVGVEVGLVLGGCHLDPGYPCCGGFLFEDHGVGGYVVDGVAADPGDTVALRCEIIGDCLILSGGEPVARCPWICSFLE